MDERFGFRLLAFVVASAACFSAPAATLTTLYNSDLGEGRHPNSGLVADASGALYGSTRYGGAYNFGSVYRIDPTTGDFATLVSFDYDVTGVTSPGDLLLHRDGMLYGTAAGSASYGPGVVFKIDPSTGELSFLDSFGGPHGWGPGRLMPGPSEKLYGVTSHYGDIGFLGGGTVFEFDLVAGELKTLAYFSDFDQGFFASSVIADAAGNLYGTTADGGVPGYHGTVFKYDRSNGDLTTLHSFDERNGDAPAGLLWGKDGLLYGTTHRGGYHHEGTLYRIDPETGDFELLYSFDSHEGIYPATGLLADAAGNLYGMATRGGAHGSGAVYKFDLSTAVLTTLFSFNGDNGIEPRGHLIADSQGNLYGTTYGGGAPGPGTVFMLSDTGFVVAPEPAGLLLAAIGLGGAAWRRRGDRP
ncbi:hypothetical protein Mal64_12650 [Pseudobythopirellula maris]|uniref:PEP-CTERM protein-sorting domain-containing protein n=1 Tax=Pseudobythopirellula maris TaxID=2527991 RepID=A0A5C5ZV43_9BACT|nr:choice-of-anchor tandem repeat GloVer-containing protein [Pseudobythopirellula maris]TWT90867.1 hypothetical protein Mal64_12650 [Pseudobythopirellula maris]